MAVHTYNASFGRYAGPATRRNARRELDFGMIRDSADEFSGKVIRSFNSIPEVKALRGGNARGARNVKTSYQDKVVSLIGLGAFMLTSIVSMMVFI